MTNLAETARQSGVPAERFRTWRLDIDASLAAAIESSPSPPKLG